MAIQRRAMEQFVYDTQSIRKRGETAVNLQDLKRFTETYHTAVMYKAFDELSLDDQSQLEMLLHDVLLFVNEKMASVDQ